MSPADSLPMQLFSADPGSSGKGWAVADCVFEAGSRIRMRQLSGAGLGTLIDDICAAALEHHVLLALDAPVRVFGDMQTPTSFEPLGVGKGGRAWPFNVNPFSQRPCEHALSSKPTVVNDSLMARELAQAIGQLCGWDVELRRSGNVPFTSLHEGVSVMGYMSAPHAPIVSAFLDALARSAASSGVQISHDPASELIEVGSVTVLESHPAVALGFYAAHRMEGFPASIPAYKMPPKKNEPACLRLAGVVTTWLGVQHQATLIEPITTDDELDALVGMLNLLDQATSEGDLFGTIRDGYFLVPRRNGARTYQQI